MTKFLLLLSLLVWTESSVCEVPLCADNCPAGEIYSRCGAGVCEANCWNQPASDCPCTAGCVCGPGLIRHPNTYKCVKPKSCPMRMPGQCPLNESWSECLGGCQKSCDTRLAQFKCKCIPGCVCRSGYIRSSITGQCIPLASCDSCPPGYSLDPKTKRCHFCCQECPENEEYNECGSSCEPNCKDPTLASTLCITMCKPGCFCKKGFVRGPKGICIPKDSCPVCNVNEEYSCGNPSCEKNCNNLKENCTIVNIRCEDKCYCKEGFVRSFAGGPCVPINTCKSKGCPYHEYFSCGNRMCEKNCNNLKEPCTIVNIKCDEKCYCQPGFVRREADGPCVPVATCNRKG